MQKIKWLVKKAGLYPLYQACRKILFPLELKFAQVDRRVPTEYALNTDSEVVVSLTSFPERIESVQHTLYTLMRQTYKPSKIILWLAIEQFPAKEDDLPESLLALKTLGLSIEWVQKDIRSYKKLLPTLALYPDNIIVTTDDDVYYPVNWLDTLMQSYNSDKTSIHCHVITRIQCNKGGATNIPSTKNMVGGATYNNKVLGAGGVLYPAHSLDEEVLDIEKAMEIAPTSDDIWFWGMALKKGTKICWIKNNMRKLYYVEGVQETTPCLHDVNDSGEHFFQIHLNQIIKTYQLESLLQ